MVLAVLLIDLCFTFLISFLCMRIRTLKSHRRPSAYCELVIYISARAALGIAVLAMLPLEAADFRIPLAFFPAPIEYGRTAVLILFQQFTYSLLPLMGQASTLLNGLWVVGWERVYTILSK
jgi:hypothetical protein